MSSLNNFKVQCSKSGSQNIALVFALYELGFKSQNEETAIELIHAFSPSNIFAYAVEDSIIYLIPNGTEKAFYAEDELEVIQIKKLNLQTDKYIEFFNNNKNRIENVLTSLSKSIDNADPLMISPEFEKKIEYLTSYLETNSK
jgi:hypothetical protein